MVHSAVIDIGTHSALLLIANLTHNQVLPIVDIATTTKLGEGLAQTGQISQAAMVRLLAVLADYQTRLTAYAIDQVQVVGTAVFRQAHNAQSCQAQIQQRLGWPLSILTEDEEATYAFRGMQQLVRSHGPIPGDQPIVAIDMGGGSTEIIYGDATGIHWQWSLPVGAMTLKDQYVSSETLSVAVAGRLDDHLMQLLQPLPLPLPSWPVIVTGGTVTTLASLKLELSQYSWKHIDGFCCTVPELDMLYRELNQLSVVQRQDLVGMEPGRADVILPALRLLLALLNHFNRDTMIITVRGVRYGLLDAAVDGST